MEKYAKSIVKGDVFEYKGRIEVAVDDWHGGLVWTSTLDKYKDAIRTPGPTNACLTVIDGDVIVHYDHIPTIAECEESEDRWEDSLSEWRY